MFLDQLPFEHLVSKVCVSKTSLYEKCVNLSVNDSDNLFVIFFVLIILFILVTKSYNFAFNYKTIQYGLTHLLVSILLKCVAVVHIPSYSISSHITTQKQYFISYPYHNLTLCTSYTYTITHITKIPIHASIKYIHVIVCMQAQKLFKSYQIMVPQYFYLTETILIITMFTIPCTITYSVTILSSFYCGSFTVYNLCLTKIYLLCHGF